MTWQSSVKSEQIVLGYIYCIGISEGFNPYVKIGRSTRHPLNGRLAQLQTACPLELRLVDAFPVFAGNIVALEKAIHSVFSNFLHRGEWFRARPRDIALEVEHLVSAHNSLHADKPSAF